MLRKPQPTYELQKKIVNKTTPRPKNTQPSRKFKVNPLKIIRCLSASEFGEFRNHFKFLGGVFES